MQPNKPTRWPVRPRILALASLVLCSVGVLISCVTVSRTVVAPPHIPGADYVGDKACAECHDNITKLFPTATHARIKAEGPHAQMMGCEACHGPGSLHSESGGARGTILNPSVENDVCFQCHLEMKGKFALSNHHPLEPGKVSCSDCHDPHKGHAAPGGVFALGAPGDATCVKCHTAQRGPFVFEHEAIREGCTTCHDPHGSVNDKMLTQRNANLCLKCHFQQQTAPGRVFIGGRDHSAFLNRGTCWSAGCHEAVHGSHISSSLRF